MSACSTKTFRHLLSTLNPFRFSFQYLANIGLECAQNVNQKTFGSHLLFGVCCETETWPNALLHCLDPTHKQPRGEVECQKCMWAIILFIFTSGFLFSWFFLSYSLEKTWSVLNLPVYCLLSVLSVLPVLKPNLKLWHMEPTDRDRLQEVSHFQLNLTLNSPESKSITLGLVPFPRKSWYSMVTSLFLLKLTLYLLKHKIMFKPHSHSWLTFLKRKESYQ